jgi:hypothetical protein
LIFTALATVSSLESICCIHQVISLFFESLGTAIAQSLPERTGKQCRERYHNHLDTGIKKGEWSEEEDRIIIILQKAIGNQWAKITKMLPGRTDNAVKNRFHATERAKSRGKLDDSFLNDTTYTEHIIREALRINGELGSDSNTTSSAVSDSDLQAKIASLVAASKDTAITNQEEFDEELDDRLGVYFIRFGSRRSHSLASSPKTLAPRSIFCRSAFTIRSSIVPGLIRSIYSTLFF